jgi:hypothetical protein
VLEFDSCPTILNPPSSLESTATHAPGTGRRATLFTRFELFKEATLKSIWRNTTEGAMHPFATHSASLQGSLGQACQIQGSSPRPKARIRLVLPSWYRPIACFHPSQLRAGRKREPSSACPSSRRLAFTLRASDHGIAIADKDDDTKHAKDDEGVDIVLKVRNVWCICCAAVWCVLHVACCFLLMQLQPNHIVEAMVTISPSYLPSFTWPRRPQLAPSMSIVVFGGRVIGWTVAATMNRLCAAITLWK